MSMKTAQTPRRIYNRNGVTHACFEGRTFGPVGESALSLELPVTCEKVKSDGGRARVEVSQRRPGQATLVEVWRSVRVPCKPRA